MTAAGRVTPRFNLVMRYRMNHRLGNAFGFARGDCGWTCPSVVLLLRNLPFGEDCGWARPSHPPGAIGSASHGWGGARTDLSSPTGVKGPRGGGARVGLHQFPNAE